MSGQNYGPVKVTPVSGDFGLARVDVEERDGTGGLDGTHRHPGAPGRTRGQAPLPAGYRWLTGPGALRYSLAVRAPLRAVRVARDLVGGRTLPSTYDLTK